LTHTKVVATITVLKAWKKDVADDFQPTLQDSNSAPITINKLHPSGNSTAGTGLGMPLMVIIGSACVVVCAVVAALIFKQCCRSRGTEERDDASSESSGDDLQEASAEARMMVEHAASESVASSVYNTGSYAHEYCACARFPCNAQGYPAYPGYM